MVKIASLRCLISITDMPLPCQSINSACACIMTSVGNIAGPAPKLQARPECNSGTDFNWLFFITVAIFNYSLKTRQTFAFAQGHQPYTLCITPDHRNLIDRCPDQRTLIADQHDLVILIHGDCTHDLAITFGGLN